MPDSKPSIETIAPSVEEAVERGARELGVSPDDLEVEVLDEGSSGLFGVGSRQARVRVTLVGEGSDVERPADAREHVRTAPAQAEADSEDEDQATLKLAVEAIQDLLELMEVSADVEAHWGDPDAPGRTRPLFVDITGNDLSVLIGRHGDTLEDFQYIVRLILGKELKKSVPLVIDVEGYRARREQTLRRLARRMADQAIDLGRTVSLEPMPPNERRWIHVELRDNDQVRTESVGEGDQRKVTIIPEG